MSFLNARKRLQKVWEDLCHLRVGPPKLELTCALWTPSLHPLISQEARGKAAAKSKLWWVGDEICDKTHISVRKSLYFVLAIKSGQSNLGTKVSKIVPFFVVGLIFRHFPTQDID